MREFRKVVCVVSTAFMLFFLTGCPRIKRQLSLAAPALPAAMKGEDYSLETYQRDLAAYDAAMCEPSAGLPGSRNAGGLSVKAEPVLMLTSCMDEATARVLRDKIAYGLMEDIDLGFAQYTTRLYSGKGFEAVGVDTLVLGLSSAATIATHVATKTILSALGTGFAGVGLSIDKNFFAQQTFQIIAIAMQTRRDKARDAIRVDLSGNGVKTLPLNAVKRDLIAYYNAGSLAGGLMEIQEETGDATALDKQQRRENSAAFNLSKVQQKRIDDATAAYRRMLTDAEAAKAQTTGEDTSGGDGKTGVAVPKPVPLGETMEVPSMSAAPEEVVPVPVPVTPLPGERRQAAPEQPRRPSPPPMGPPH